jgi:flagellar biosynthesis anti-sigma factor FlgM
MRIDLNSATSISGSQVEKTSSSHSTHTGAVTNSDKSQFSESDLSVGKLTAAALNSPEARTEKVQSLRSQLESGNYQISASQIASSVLDQMRLRA